MNKINLKKSLRLMLVCSFAFAGSTFVPAHAVNSATGAKSGSFNYNNYDSTRVWEQCPGPYDSVGVNMINNMDETYEWYGSHSYPVWVNIYYVVADNRKYESELNQAYHLNESYAITEDRKKAPDSISTSSDMYIAATGANSTGPIWGAHNQHNEAQTPTRLWSGDGDGTELYRSLKSTYGSQLKVATISMYSGTYMDWKGHQGSFRLPVRSYKVLFIEAWVGASQQGDPNDWIRYTNIVWGGKSEPGASGALIETTTSIRGLNKKDIGSISNLPLGKVVDLRTVDSFNISASGTLEKMGGELIINYFVDKKTGKKITCNNI